VSLAGVVVVAGRHKLYLVNKQKKHTIVNLIKTVLQLELRWLLRSHILLLLLIIYLVTGYFSLYYGHGLTTERQMAIEDIHQDYRHRLDSMVNAFRTADTSTAAGKTTVRTLSEPAVVQYRLKAEALLLPVSFSSLSVGISDMAGYRHTADINWRYAAGEEKISNPLKLLTGHFDLSFFLIYIIPLIVAGLNYNLVSGEKEQGTLLLLRLQCNSLTTLLALRVLSRLLLLWLLFVSLTITGLLLPGTGHVSAAMFFYWSAIAALYIGIWSGISFLIVTLNQSSALNALTLLCTWLILLILLPAACSLLYASHRQAPGRMAAVAAAQRETEWAVWELPKKQLLDSFYAGYPAYKDALAYDTSPGSGRRSMAYYHLLQLRMDRFTLEDERQRQQQQKRLAATYFTNPAVYTQSLCNEVAETDVADYTYFNSQVKRFHEEWKQFFYAYAFKNKRFTPAAYYTLPRFVMPRDTGKISRLLAGLRYLLLLCTACWLAGWLTVKQHLKT
jgi:ABC-2 type transport system permease protein